MIDIALGDKDKGRLEEIDAQILKWTILDSKEAGCPALFQELRDVRGMLESLLFDIKYYEE